MSWHASTTAASDPRKEIVRDMVRLATSKSVKTVAVAAGGTGYVVGDTLTLTHASANLDATFKVTSVSSGVIDGLRIVNGGAFGRRVATAVINAAGTGYNAGDIVEIDESHTAGTDFFQRCQITVDTVTGGPPGPAATISILEGGNYDGGTDPTATASTTTKTGPSTGSGSGLTVDVTMTPIITALSGLSVTGGTGSGATVTISLGDINWQADVDRHDYSFNSVNDEREIWLTNQPTTGDPVSVGLRTFTENPGTPHEGILWSAATSVNPATAFASQAGVLSGSTVPSTTTGAFTTLIEDAATEFWLTVNINRIFLVAFNDDTTDSYVWGSAGVGKRIGTAIDNVLAAYVGASSSSSQISPTAGGIDQQGPVECFRHASRTGPTWFRDPSGGTWTEYENGEGTGFPVTPQDTNVVTPIGSPDQATQAYVGFAGFEFSNSIGQTAGTAATLEWRPTPGSGGYRHLVPCDLVTEVGDGKMRFRFDGLYWLCAINASGTVYSAKDTVTVTTSRVGIVFPSGDRTTQYSFFCLIEGE